MIKKYLIERRSWIILFILLHLLIIFIAYIDPSIPFSSILYIVFLSFIIFTVFFIIRYNKETKLYQKMEIWDHRDDITLLETSNSPFEKIILENLSLQPSNTKMKSQNTKRISSRKKMSFCPGFTKLKHH